MTTATLLIQAAYREGNLVPVGMQPTTAEQTEALAALNRFINGIFGFEMGENLADWLFPQPQRTAPVAANYPQLPYPNYSGVLANTYLSPYPPKNSRLIWGAVTGTVYFPEAPEPGSRMAFIQASGAGDSGAVGQILTLNGNGRTIEAANTVTITSLAAPGAPPRQWLYRDDLGDWVKCQDLATINDDCPFPKEFDDFFICALAKRLGPRYGKITAAETVETARVTLARLKARYRQSAPTVYGSENFPNGAQSFRSGQWWL